MSAGVATALPTQTTVLPPIPHTDRRKSIFKLLFGSTANVAVNQHPDDSSSPPPLNDDSSEESTSRSRRQPSEAPSAASSTSTSSTATAARLVNEQDNLFPSLVSNAKTFDDNNDVWKLFTKVKEAFPNGARLENMTWRLMHMQKKKDKETKEKEQHSSQLTADPVPMDVDSISSQSNSVAMKSSTPVPMNIPGTLQPAPEQHLSVTSMVDSPFNFMQGTTGLGFGSFDPAMARLDGEQWMQEFLSLDGFAGEDPSAVLNGFQPSMFSDIYAQQSSEPVITGPLSMFTGNATPSSAPELAIVESTSAPAETPPPNPRPTSRRPPSRLHENTVCKNCSTDKTSLWRRNPSGEPLCNACGLFFKLHGTDRPISLKTDVIRRRNRGKGTAKAAKDSKPGTSAPRESVPPKGGTAPTLLRSMSSPNLHVTANNGAGLSLPAAGHLMHQQQQQLPTQPAASQTITGAPAPRSQLTAGLLSSAGPSAGPSPLSTSFTPDTPQPIPAQQQPPQQLPQFTPPTTLNFQPRESVGIPHPPMNDYSTTPKSHASSFVGSWSSSSTISVPVANGFQGSYPNGGHGGPPDAGSAASSLGTPGQGIEIPFHLQGGTSQQGFSFPTPAGGVSTLAPVHAANSNSWAPGVTVQPANKRMRTALDSQPTTLSASLPEAGNSFGMAAGQHGQAQQPEQSQPPQPAQYLDMRSLFAQLQHLIQLQTQQLQNQQLQQQQNQSQSPPQQQASQQSFPPVDHNTFSYQHPSITIPADNPTPAYHTNISHKQDPSPSEFGNMDLLSMLGTGDPAGALTEELVDRWGQY